jgi:hypothetical protein
MLASRDRGNDLVRREEFGPPLGVRGEDGAVSSRAHQALREVPPGRLVDRLADVGAVGHEPEGELAGDGLRGHIAELASVEDQREEPGGLPRTSVRGGGGVGQRREGQSREALDGLALAGDELAPQLGVLVRQRREDVVDEGLGDFGALAQRRIARWTAPGRAASARVVAQGSNDRLELRRRAGEDARADEQEGHQAKHRNCFR